MQSNLRLASRKRARTLFGKALPRPVSQKWSPMCCSNWRTALTGIEVTIHGAPTRADGRSDCVTPCVAGSGTTPAIPAQRPDGIFKVTVHGLRWPAASLASQNLRGPTPARHYETQPAHAGGGNGARRRLRKLNADGLPWLLHHPAVQGRLACSGMDLPASNARRTGSRTRLPCRRTGGRAGQGRAALRIPVSGFTKLTRPLCSRC